MAEYDDKNRGALFTDGKPGWTGKINFNGQDYYGALVATGAQNERAPSHKLFLEVAERGGAAVCIPLWRDDPEKPSFASGKHEGHFVNAYQNTTDSGRVYLSIQFKAMQNQGGEPAASRQEAPATTDSLI